MKLKLENLSKTFSQGSAALQILNGLDLMLPSGEVIAVIGESGSGKSTLLSLLAGFDRPSAGEIFWDGQAAGSWSPDDWARFRRVNLGFIFQNYYLIPYLTALENVALPLRLLGQSVNAEAEAARYLEQMGLGHRLNHLPSQLSGGESQRVGIARALIHQPKLVLADEPTGSLDSKTGTQILEALFQQLQSRQQTALIVTHSHEVADRCSRVYALKAGKLCLQ